MNKPMKKKERLLISMEKKKWLKDGIFALCLTLLVGLFSGCAAEMSEVGVDATDFEGNTLFGKPSADTTDATENSSKTAPIEIPEAGNIVASGWCGSDITWVENGEGGLKEDGSNVSWTLDDEGILTISGTGEMSGTSEDVVLDDAPFGGTRGETVCISPWYDSREDIKFIVVEEGVTLISELAFSECSNVLAARLPESVRTIELGAFYKCKSLREVNIPGSVSTLNYAVFGGCESLTSIVVPEGMRRIKESAFSYCNSLTNISLPDTLELIDRTAFSTTGYADDLDHWDNGVLYIGSYLIKAEAEISGDYNVKEGTRLIANEAFQECKNLKNVTLPEGLQRIGYHAFYSCRSLESLTIPKSVIRIEAGAFRDSGLKNVVFLGDKPRADVDTFSGVTATVHYPSGNASWEEPFEDWQIGDDSSITFVDDVKNE